MDAQEKFGCTCPEGSGHQHPPMAHPHSPLGYRRQDLDAWADVGLGMDVWGCESLSNVKVMDVLDFTGRKVAKGPKMSEAGVLCSWFNVPLNRMTQNRKELSENLDGGTGRREISGDSVSDTLPGVCHRVGGWSKYRGLLAFPLPYLERGVFQV